MSLAYPITSPSIDLRNILLLFDNSFLHDGHIFFPDSPCFLSLLDDGADEPSKVKATGVKCFMLIECCEIWCGYIWIENQQHSMSRIRRPAHGLQLDVLE